MKLRIKKYYRFGRFGFYTIEKNIDGRWHNVFDLGDVKYSVAKKIKDFLLRNPDLLK